MGAKYCLGQISNRHDVNILVQPLFRLLQTHQYVYFQNFDSKRLISNNVSSTARNGRLW